MAEIEISYRCISIESIYDVTRTLKTDSAMRYVNFADLKGLDNEFSEFTAHMLG